MMSEIEVSVCYYPTTVALVDDKKSFLDDLKLGLDESIPAKFYHDPKSFLHYFQQCQVAPLIDHCAGIDEDAASDHITQNVVISTIHQEIYNPQRFAQVSVVIVDYAMPSMNGLTCCQQITDPYVKKILLTGEADNDIAVQAFNKGLIDRFIQKSTPQLMVQINRAVADLQANYFLQLSRVLCGPKAALNSNIPSCLSDPLFADFFQAFCQQQRVAEYYLLDQYGSFLLLDAAGEASWLIVHDENTLEGFCQEAEFADAPLEVLNPLKNKQKVLFLYSEADNNKAPNEWANYLHPATCFKGKNTYYYAYLTKSKTYQIEAEKILTYQRFCK